MTVYDERPWLAQYPKEMPGELPLPTQTLADAFRATLHRDPHGAALYFFDETITVPTLTAPATQWRSH